MVFFGNTTNIYYLYTDNQAAEHIATQPNMNDHSRSIDIRIHGIRQDYLAEAMMRIGGVASEDNTTDILTMNLQPHLHQKHCAHLHISAHKTKHGKKGTTLTNNSVRLTSRWKTNKLRSRPNQHHPTQMPTQIPGHPPSPLVVEPNAAYPQQTHVDPLDLPHASLRRQLVPLVDGEERKLIEQLKIPL